jgi:voltage-gated potassium channel
MKNLSAWDKLLFILSIYVVVELYLSFTLTYSEAVTFWTSVVDTIICVLFLIDFFWGLYKAEKKWDYFKKNWIHFISSIPFVGVVRIGRVAKVLKILRLLRSGKVIYSIINRNNSLSTFKNLLILNIFFIFFISLSFFNFEYSYNPAIKSFSDSFWWSLITTISFSYLKNIPPVTFEGQILSIVLMIMRMVLFGTLISTLTDFFLGAGKEKSEDHQKTMTLKIEALEEKLTNIEKILQRMEEQNKNSLTEK